VNGGTVASVEAGIGAIGPIWRELYGRLWHTTHPERFLGILNSAAILPEPPIPDSERWGTLNGPRNYPYVRSIGGVSLFDFSEFEPDTYNSKYVASWGEFLPFRRAWAGAIWIEIDPSKLGSYVPGPELLIRWKSGTFLGHNIMPRIEAANVGPVPLNAMLRALAISVGDSGMYHEMSIDNFDNRLYSEWLERWRVEHSDSARAGRLFNV